MVVLEGGAPKKSDYRKFGIRGGFDKNGDDPVPPADAKRRRRRPDDVAAMQEVLTRRLGRYLQQADISPHDSDRDSSFGSAYSYFTLGCASGIGP